MANVTVPMLMDYIGISYNILASGLAGTGKTEMLRTACEKLGLKMKYYSASTLDPWADLAGIPIPQHDSKSVEFYRPHALDEAEVVFFDELNRAPTRILNTILEIIQFRTINGEPLPNLKCVVAAINPNTEDYTVNDLDVALMDRFDVFLTTEPRIDFAYWSEKYGADIAKVVKSWWEDYHKSYTNKKRNSANEVVYLSPRRMEKMLKAYIQLRKETALRDTLPMNASANTSGLRKELERVLKGGKADDAVEEKKPAKADEPIDLSDVRSLIIGKDKPTIASPAMKNKINQIFLHFDKVNDRQVLLATLDALSDQKKPEDVVGEYLPVISTINAESEMNRLMNKWSYEDCEKFVEEVEAVSKTRTIDNKDILAKIPAIKKKS